MINKEDIVSRRETAIAGACDDDFLVIDLKSGTFCGLGEVGGFIWHSLDGERNLERIAECVSRRYGIEGARAELDVIAFVDQLFDRGLVETASS